MAIVHNKPVEEFENIPAVLESEEENSGADFDLETLLMVVRKSLPWVIILILLGLLGAFLYVRYTPKVYMATSLLKIDEQSEAGALGLNKIGGIENKSGLAQLSGEIELLKSNLIYEKLRDGLNLDVNYYVRGKVLDQEIYKASPFNVIFKIKNDAIYDQNISLNVLDAQHFRLIYQIGETAETSDHKFGEIIINPYLDLKVIKTDGFSNSAINQDFYFRINSPGSVLNYLSTNLVAQIVNPDARTISISFTDHNPVKARDIVNRLDSVYLQHKRETKNQSNEQTISFLRDQLDETKTSLQNAEANLESFAKRNKSYDIKADLAASRMKIEELQKEKEDIRLRIALMDNVSALLMRNTNVEQIIPTLGALADPQLTSKIEELSKLQTNRTRVLASNQPGTFAVTSIETQVQKFKKDIQELLSRNRELLQNQIVQINTNSGTIESELLNMPQKETEAIRLKRFFDLYEKFYLLLMEKQVEFGIAKAGTTPDFQILSPSNLPTAPISPNKLMVYAIGLASGLFFGIGLIAARYFLHNTVTNMREVERMAKVPVLGIIPKYEKEKLTVSKLIVDKNPKSAISEAIRSIRTNLEFISSSKQKRLISVTSTISGEGKTFVAVNLGGIIALSDLKVVLLDLDMRKPKVNLAFGGDNTKGISTILIEKHTVQECLQPTSIGNLQYIPAGPTPPNPSELILSPIFDKVLEELQAIYDVVIIDTPPVGLVTDGMLIMRKADIPIYIVRADYSKKAFLKNIDKVHRANGITKLTAILNDARSSGVY